MVKKVLDCTLRDGGYYNKWNFSDDFVQKYLYAISKYVSIVELGLRVLKTNDFKGPLAFTKDKWLQKFDLPTNVEYAVMLNAADFKESDNIKKDIDYLFPLNADKSKVSLVRIASRFSDFNFLSEIINHLKFKGFKVVINLMQISEYSEKELSIICAEVNKFSPYIFYIADSLGCLNPNKVERILNFFHNNMSIPLGIHAHDNIGLARQNSIKALNCGATYLDSTLLGMGRGAGNAKTEEIILELFYKENDSYYLISLFEFLHNFMLPLKNKFNWGGDYLYMLSAMYKIHPGVVQSLRSDRRYSMVEIINIFNFLKDIDSKNISYSQINEIEVFSYSNLDKSENNKNYPKFELPFFDNILLIGSGPSAENYADELKQFAEDNNCLLVTLNSLCSFTREGFHIKAACNPIRFIADKEHFLNCKEILLLPEKLVDSIYPKNINVSKKIITYNIKIASDFIGFTNYSCTLPNTLSLFYALCYLLNFKKDKIYLAGIDGYSKGDVRNDLIDKIFYELSIKTDTNFIALTPSIHKNILHNSIFNF